MFLGILYAQVSLILIFFVMSRRPTAYLMVSAFCFVLGLDVRDLDMFSFFIFRDLILYSLPFIFKDQELPLRRQSIF